MKRCCSLPALWVVAISCAGCSSDQKGLENARRGQEHTPATPAVQQLSETQEQQKQVALAARDALFQQLLNRLSDALASAGPAAAIDVCQKQAPQIAAEVSTRFGVDIGRTSHRLRNPDNAPPDWARPLVDQRTTEPQFVSLDADGLGVLLPIHLKPQCLMCHGPEQQILPDVRDALARHYPDDQATGFQEGDLRGWFWISVPGGARLPTEPEPSVPSTDVNGSQDS
jgi:hypothetical protein